MKIGSKKLVTLFSLLAGSLCGHLLIRKSAPSVHERKDDIFFGVPQVHQVKTFPLQEKKLSFSLEEKKSSSFASTAKEAEAFEDDNSELVASFLEQGFYRSKKELFGRSQRFPSVDKRARVYLSSWYNPPCNKSQRISYNYVNATDNENPNERRLMLLREFPHSSSSTTSAAANDLPRTFVASKTPKGNQLLYGDPDVFRNCSKRKWYVADAVQGLLPAWDRLVENQQTSYYKPLLFFWGDSQSVRAFTDPSLSEKKFAEKPFVPVIQKVRNAVNWTADSDDDDDDKDTSLTQWMTADSTSCRTEPPLHVAVVSKMKSNRHYQPIEQIPKNDIPWKDKKNLVVWRGSVRGVINDFSERDLRKNKTPLERCLLLRRCRLIYNTANSTLVDAGMVGNFHEGLIPEEINGTRIYKDKLNYEQMLQNKAIIMLEGNDVSTGLKWALFSNSVVMMPKPTRTSFAMEELLEPWVHYIPLNVELDDVEEKMQWIIDHDQEAEEIARRGSLWMIDMLYHPQSKRDDELVNEAIVRRFQAHFVLDPDLSLE